MSNIQDVDYQKFHDQLSLYRQPPLSAEPGPIHRAFSIERFHYHNEIFLARIPHARIVGPNGVVITSDGAAVEQSTWGCGWLERDRSFMSLRLPTPGYESGHWYTVAAPFAEGYAHWLLDVLPRFFALEFLPADEIRVLVSGPLSSWQRESLQMLDVDERQVVVLGSNYLELETLYFPSYVGDPGNPHPWGCEWLRSRLLPGTAGNTGRRRRLFISRRNAPKRRLVNEDELEQTLSLHGFEIIESDKLSFPDEVRLFSEAEAIVGPHGAGMTNALFAPEGCKILEIFDPQDVKANNYALACLLQQEYWYLVGKQAGDSRIAHGSSGHDDILLPVADLSRSLDSMFPKKSTMVAT